jgi:hypothetical protein
MQPHGTPRPRDDAAARAHLEANVQAARNGHWIDHLIALPTGGPGDFTPYDHPDYAEEETSLLGRLGLLPEWLLELGADRRLAEHQAQADMEAGG